MKNSYAEYSQEIKGHIIYPSLVIPIRSLRGRPVAWFDLNNQDGGTLKELSRNIKDMPEINHQWDNCYDRVKNGHMSFLFQVFGSHSQTGYSMAVYDDIRGAIFKSRFAPDEEGCIPKSVVMELKAVLDKWEQGIDTCRVCNEEYNHWQGYGKWYDSRCCSDVCAANSPLERMDRSR